MRSRRFLIFGLVLLVIAVLTAGAGYWGLRRQYVPPDAIAVAERFISLIEAGNFADAYSLTTQDALSGRTLEQFQANLRAHVGLKLPARFPAKYVGETGGFQTYGNRLRRWLAGRKIEQDIIHLEFDAGAPLEIRLVSSPDGKWRVTFFQTHAG
jgi:hypothetical protein